MPKGKSQSWLIEPLKSYYASKVLVLTPEDFIHIVLEQNLTVFRKKEPTKGFCYYLARDIGVQYVTRSEMELTELPVVILLQSLGLSSSMWKNLEAAPHSKL
jgi:hypothetical protein